MSEKQKKLFLLFKSAVDSERKAQDMYLRARELTDNEDLITVLKGFCQDEMRHEQKLMDQYNMLTRGRLRVSDQRETPIQKN